MTASIEDDPFKEAGMELTIAHTTFDLARHSLYDYSAELVAAPRDLDDYQAAISEEASRVSEAFIEVVRAVYATDIALEDRADKIKAIWAGDEKERKELYIQLTDCGDFACGNSQCDGTCVEQAYDTALEEASTSEEIVNKIDDFYSMELKQDVEHIAAHVEEKLKAVEAPKLSRKERVVKEAGKYAVDVSKIAVGVFIANAVSRIVRRP